MAAAAFAATLSATLVLGVVLYLDAGRIVSTARWVARAQEVRTALSRLSAAVSALEGSARGYLLAREPEFLERFDAAVEDAHEQVATLRRLTADNLDQEERLDQLETLLEAKIAFNGAILAEARSGATRKAEEKFGSLEGLRLTDEILALERTMDAEETRLADRRARDLEDERRSTVAVGLALSVVACALLYFLYRSQARERAARMRSQATVDELEQRTAVLRAVLSNMSDGVVVADAQGRFLHTNAAAERLLGVPLFDDDPSRWADDYHVFLPDATTPFPPEALPLVRALRGENVDDALLIVRPPGDPNPRWLEVAARPMRMESGSHAGGVAVFRDVTERKQAEVERLRHAAEIEDLYNCAPCGYHSLDENGTFLRINDTELAWLGYERAEVVGRMRFSDLLTPGSRPVFEKMFALFKQRGWVEGLEFEMRRKDGSTFTAILNATAVTDAQGRYVCSRSTVFDISERKEAEEEANRLNADLARRQAEIQAAYAELEGFSYSVSHDLRAPLRHMDGFLDLFAGRVAEGLDATSSRYLRLVREAAKKMGALIDDLLEFSRTGRSALRRLNVPLDRIVRELRADLAADSPSAEWRIGALPSVYGDAALLRQLWTNLLSNALKYSGSREQPVIEIGELSDGAEEEAILFVRDNGVGFDPAYAHKLFGVFQRLHGEEFEGTGIGLAIVKRVAQRHGGRVWAESKPGEGATFFVALPRSSEVPSAEPVERAAGQEIRAADEGV